MGPDTKQKQGKKERYGLFGAGSVEVTPTDHKILFAVVQESGLYAGAPPVEVRIVFLTPDEEHARLDLEERNKKTDLPFHLYEVEVKALERLA